MSVVAPRNNSKLTVLAANSKQLKSSPDAKKRNLQNNNVDKYIIGESYSGDIPGMMKKKVKQLEKKINKMKERHERQTG